MAHTFKLKLQLLSQPQTETEVNADQIVEIGLYAKNQQSLEEYAARVLFRGDYICKLEKWIARKKFSCETLQNKLKLTVEIFEFELDKILRDDIDVLKDEMRAVRNLGQRLDTEVNLFGYQFFAGQWNDNTRKKLENVLGEGHRVELMESVSALFEQVDVIGHIQKENENQDQEGAPKPTENQRYYLLSKEQINPQNQSNQSNQSLEILLMPQKSGDCKPVIANLARQPCSTMTVEESSGMNQQYVMYEVDKPITHEVKYQLNISKLPA